MKKYPKRSEFIPKLTVPFGVIIQDYMENDEGHFERCTKIEETRASANKNGRCFFFRRVKFAGKKNSVKQNFPLTK
ncbi:MAG TPA: hypothetical protein DIT08_01310 [Enterococcus sp.]|nr:hypothetical protein [Enterococcus sp.]